MAKHGASIEVAYILATGSVEIKTVDKKRPQAMGGGWEFMDPRKSKAIKRLCVELGMSVIPFTIDIGYIAEED